MLYINGLTVLQAAQTGSAYSSNGTLCMYRGLVHGRKERGSFIMYRPAGVCEVSLLRLVHTALCGWSSPCSKHLPYLL